MNLFTMRYLTVGAGKEAVTVVTDCQETTFFFGKEITGNGAADVLVTDRRETAEEAKESSLAVIYVECEGEEPLYGVDLIVTDPEELTEEEVIRCFQRKNGIPWKIGRGKGWILRESVPEDFDTLYEMAQTFAFEQVFGRAPEEKEEERARFLEEIKTAYSFFSYGRWTLLARTNAGWKIAGRIGFIYSGEEELPELSYYLSEEFRGRNLAAEGIRAALSWMNREIYAEKVFARVEKENERSRRLLEKLKFTKEKEERNLLFYGKSLDL